MSIYTKQDDGVVVPVQVEQSIEDLFKTRDEVCLSACSKVNLETLQKAATPLASSVVETTTKAASSTTSSGA